MGRGAVPAGPDLATVIRPARSASTVCVLRDRSSGLEVSMVPQGHLPRFMAGARVFPGGIVDDPSDGGLGHSVVAAGAAGGHLEESVDGEG